MNLEVSQTIANQKRNTGAVLSYLSYLHLGYLKPQLSEHADRPGSFSKY